MRKLFTLTLALLASFSLWAETVTMDCALAKGSTPSPSIGSAILSGGAFDGTGYKMSNDDNYIGWNISASGRTFNGVSFNGWINSNSTDKNWGFQFSTDGGTSWGSVLTQANDGTKSYHDINVSVSIPSGANAIRIIRKAGTSSYVSSITLTLVPNCQAPANALVLSADKTSDIYEGDEITFSTTGGNDGAITIEGADSETITANKWIATVGEHTFTASQAKNGDYCAQEAELVLNVVAATPVTACSIEGPTAGYAGYELTYTATAANATAFAWYVDDALQEGETDAEFVYTGVKGNHSIYATATNAHTATPVASAPIALTVTKLCGMLIKATTNNAVTGVVGGTYSTNNGTGDDKKLDKKKYYGVTLASGTFMAGDVFTINVKTAANNGGKCMLFADNAGTDLIIDAGAGYTSTGELTVTLPTAANGKSSIYIYRENNDNQWNPVFTWMSVTRSCEESSNTNIAELTVNGDEVTPSGSAYTYTLSSSYEEATVTVAVTPEHPLATITDNIGGALANPFTVTTPATGESSIMPFRVVAEDGSYYNYVVTINKSASLSDDATLKALSVEGYEISPAFDAETTAYTITKAYGAETPAVGKVTATPNDANANAEVVLAADVYTITVTAEDGKTTKEYTITVNTADAKKDLLEASFSNGANGYILNGNIQVPYLAGTSEPTFTAARFWNADGEPTAEIVDSKLVVTGADAKTAQYTIEYVEVTPMEASYDLITFTEVPSYIFSVYGWASDKGVKFSKDVEETSNHRISEGKDRIYIALPAAKSVILTGGSAGARPIKVTVNGVVDSKVTSTPAKDETITISLNQSAANFIGIESNGNNGDAGFTKMQLVQSDPTALNNTADEIKAVKFVENGQLFIRRGEKVYTITGEEVK